MNAGFIKAVLAYLLRGRLSFPGGHRPLVGHVIPEAFAGVGLAASPDPAVDDWIVEKLRQSGIRNIRIDFTYGDQDGPAARLLARLLDEGFMVVLHLLQPAPAARQMPQQAAALEWRQFVASALETYGSRVAMVEICSTVNRQRWAGYSLDGFLAAWEIAWQEVRRRALPLAGPSVTDFEPPWNVGLLDALRKRGQLPDIHTDNLFCERSTEPERYDHKILGRRLAGLIKVNLVKKARLLQRIGADFGVPRLFSPAAFWTLPRIERLLPDSEEKQADYLARYMVLCAASGSLEGAWWGPLICHREGLVDDGVAGYPKLERITHYAGVAGLLGALRPRPALAALATFARMIPGARYEACCHSGQGLEIHAFRKSGQLLHVVWTINGRAVALTDLYLAADLASAQLFDRDGRALAQPSLVVVGESPVYLGWPAGQEVMLREASALLPALALHRHQPARHPYCLTVDGWRGVVLAANPDEALLLLQQLHPAKLGQPRSGSVLRHARNAVWSVADPRDAARRLVVKQPVKQHMHKRLLDRFKPSKSMRSWNGTCELLRRGVMAAPPVLLWEKLGGNDFRDNYYLCEHVAADASVREMAVAFAQGAGEFLGVTESAAYRQLADFLLRMHNRGILFRDLSGGNVLVCAGAPGTLAFTLIDTGRIRVIGNGLSTGQRLSDLVRVCNKLHWAGRRQFLEHYFGALGRRLRGWHWWYFLAYDTKVILKRKLGRKAWKHWFRAGSR